ncbi:MAG: hypothetical protein U5N55_09930 [Cypionkella sp.]|nr:hypothetical protein [Cypionkella sp.]
MSKNESVLCNSRSRKALQAYSVKSLAVLFAQGATKSWRGVGHLPRYRGHKAFFIVFSGRFYVFRWPGLGEDRARTALSWSRAAFAGRSGGARHEVGAAAGQKLTKKLNHLPRTSKFSSPLPGRLCRQIWVKLKHRFNQFGKRRPTAEELRCASRSRRLGRQKAKIAETFFRLNFTVRATGKDLVDCNPF